MNNDFSDDQTIRDVIQHMNDDHHDACLAIAQALGDTDSSNLVKATMLGMDAYGVEFSTMSGNGEQKNVYVAFNKPITRDSQIRGHLVALTKRARAKLEQ